MFRSVGRAGPDFRTIQTLTGQDVLGYCRNVVEPPWEEQMTTYSAGQRELTSLVDGATISWSCAVAARLTPPDSDIGGIASKK